MTLRQYDALHNALRKREQRQQGLQVQQMGHLIAMVANCAARPIFDDWRKPEEFWPPAYFDDPDAEPVEDDFDEQMLRAMKRAVAYQAGQVARGL